MRSLQVRPQTAVRHPCNDGEAVPVVTVLFGTVRPSRHWHLRLPVNSIEVLQGMKSLAQMHKLPELQKQLQPSKRSLPRKMALELIMGLSGPLSRDVSGRILREGRVGQAYANFLRK